MKDVKLIPKKVAGTTLWNTEEGWKQYDIDMAKLDEYMLKLEREAFYGKIDEKAKTKKA